MALALNRFAESSNIRLFYDSALAEGLSSPGLKGRYNSAEALSHLLAGTGLTFRQTGPGAFTLERAPQSADGAIQLGAVRVEGEAGRDSFYAGRYAGIEERATGPVDGYIARRSATGTKTDTPLIEIPQSISIIPADEMAVRRVRDLADALNYVAGVIPRTEASDLTGDGFVIRGFEAGAGSVYRDGQPLTVAFYDGQQEPYGLERIEVLKGAASLLFGATEPGGIVNLVTKRPTTTPIRELNVDVGTYNRWQISGDFAGGIGGRESDWSYRLTFLTRNSDTFIDYKPDDRDFVAASLRWAPSEATSLTLRGEYLRRQTVYINGFPSQGTIDPNPNGKIRRSYFPGIPGWNKYDSESKSLGYQFEHGFGGGLTLRHNLNYVKTDTTMLDGGPSGLAANLRDANRNYALSRDDGTERFATDTSLEAAFATGPINHKLIVGVDTNYSEFGTDFFNYTVNGPVLSYFDPVYEGITVDLTTARPNYYYEDQKGWRTGLYLQDQMKIAERWVIVAGLRHDWTRSRSTPADGVSPSVTETTNATTGRFGVVYLADNGIAPFVSFSQSFAPQSGRDRLGNRFSPTRGEQFEAGVRWQPEGGDTMLSAVAYQLTKSNVLATDPDDYNQLVELGEVRSRGIELEARARFSAATNLIAIYAYTDSKTTESSPVTPEEVGKQSGNVPKHQASLWLDHDFAALGLAGFTLGGGVRYIGETRALFRDLDVPSYTVVDALVSYDIGSWRFAVNASNLFDRNYVTCTYNCFYGEPRRVVGTVTYRW
ncbi:TonB-dependent siderophore receptor [Sandaracinobacter sp. RS1-74]|uniref:TonB-dependent siderophore receptor n=1 Tax=Sandaracinobacteroides sayramensis TaxID=2913411 RepID=UPI001EDBAA06|nr:TonB-dependent siderophore receptor [Sandaracinobacteroides sayramensis]MCG2840136.1 TonB-dependent siderophore receptor [Sandaracinobacteroides sayramensis]